MSRGFVKEEDQEEAPFIPPRAALPPGVINYVTPTGLEQLRDERDRLERERAGLEISGEKEKRHTQAVLDGKLNLLRERISSARVLKTGNQPADEVRFGAVVRLKFLNEARKGEEVTFQVVGVDEADIEAEKIAFLAPLARAMTGKKVGEQVELRLGNKIQFLEILQICYQ